MHPTHKPVLDPVDSVAVATPADLLRCAAIYLHRHGWTQDDYYQRHSDTPAMPPACAVGAIAMAAYGTAVDTPSAFDGPELADFNRAVDFLDLYLTDTYGVPVYTWNDVTGRTADQVIAALCEAADDWDTTHAGGAQ
jgi:hypothetical protein